jgi:hypothetical protein
MPSRQNSNIHPRREGNMVATAKSVEAELATIPRVAELTAIPLDRLRAKVRRAESCLLATGIMVRAGRYRLVRIERLAELREVIGE